MTTMTNEEWKAVQEALVVGGLQECINGILASRFSGPMPVSVNVDNRWIIERAYDDGDGSTVTLAATDDYPWFAGLWDGSEVMLGLEHDGTLYSIVHASGGGQVSVIVGSGILDNDAGLVFQGVDEAKAYVQGLTAAK